MNADQVNPGSQSLYTFSNCTDFSLMNFLRAGEIYLE